MKLCSMGRSVRPALAALALIPALLVHSLAAQTAEKPNIILIVSDDFGYGDSGPYGGGEGRGMPTPGIDQLAAEGMTFFSLSVASRVSCSLYNTTLVPRSPPRT